MGCGASSQPAYTPEDPNAADKPADPPPAAPAETPAAEAPPEAPAEIKVDGGADIQIACPDPEPEGDEDGPKDRGPFLPFCRFDKTAVPKELSNGELVYLKMAKSDGFLGGSSDKMDCEATEMDGTRCFAIERFKGEGPVKDGDGVLLKHVESGLYVQAKSDQYPVTLVPKAADEPAQVFSIFKIGHPLGVRHKDTVYLQSWLSNYVEKSATITGEPVVVARRWRRADTTAFTILKKDIIESTTTDLARKMQFQAFDLEGSGSIGRANMAFMLKHIKGETSEEELDSIFAAADPEETGNILYDGFRTWADSLAVLSEEQLQHGEVIGNTAQRCNDALYEEKALIEVLSTAGLDTCTEMKATYAAKFATEEGPGDLPGAIDKKASEQDGWIFSSNWKLAMRALMEDEVELWTRCLYDAMNGWGTDEDSLTYLVCTIPERIRFDIFKRYNERYGKGLLEHIQSEVSGSYKTVLEKQAMAPEDCKAQLLYEAMKGLGTDEGQLIRIIAGCDIPERKQISEAFLKMSGATLISWVKGDTSGDFQKSLVCLLEAEESEFDLEKDCETMKTAMEGWGTDEAALIKVICSKTSRQMIMINEKFREMYDRELFDWVKSETSGNFQATLLGCIRHPMEQLAECVRWCMKGWGTDERGLLTMLVHLPDFKKEALKLQYRKQFSRDLIKDIKGDCSGNYEKALLALVRPAPRVWAEAIKAAMKGLGTSDQLLINFMCIAKDEMGEVRKAFKMINDGQSLVDWIEGDTSFGDYRRTLVGLANRNTEDDPTMMPIYWAQRGRDAVVDVSTLKNLLVALPSVAIKRGMAVYEAVYQKTLADEIATKCTEGASWFQWSNYYKKAMLNLLKMPVELYVQGLFDAMNGLGTDEKTLTALVCTIPENMYDDIHKVYAEKYEAERGSKKTLLEHIESETSFAYKKVLLYQAADWATSRAMAFRNALEGMGTDEKQLTRICLCTTIKQRGKIAERYREMYNKGLVAHIEEDTAGPFETSFRNMMVGFFVTVEPQPDDAFDYEEDVNKLKEAMDGAGTDEGDMIAVVSGKSDEQIQMLKDKYQEITGESLYERIDSETWDVGTGPFLHANFRATILGLLRPPMERMAYCVRDCIEGFGTDDTGLITLLVHMSERKRKDLIEAYKDIPNGGDLIEKIKGDTSTLYEGNYQDCLLSLVQPAPYRWALALKGAMAGLGTSDELLINFMCIAKDRMDEVRAAFAEQNDGQELAKWIDGDCGNKDYKDLLMRLANRDVYKFAIPSKPEVSPPANPGGSAMVVVPPPPSPESALYKFCVVFNKYCMQKLADPSVDVKISEPDQQTLGAVFMLYAKKSSCAPDLDKQGLWDLTNAVGFPPEDDGPGLNQTFLEWDWSNSGAITWNDFVREMTDRVNCDAHYGVYPDGALKENPPPGEGNLSN